jgi:Tol biopolymer transport system component
MYRASYSNNTNHILYSPDGKWLSLTEGKELQIMPAAGGESRVVYECKQEGESLGEFRWSPDGKYIVSVLGESRQNKFSIWRIPIEGGDTQKVLEMNKSSHENIKKLSLHPDGQHIAFQSTSPLRDSEVWVMEKFLPKTENAK